MNQRVRTDRGLGTIVGVPTEGEWYGIELDNEYKPSDYPDAELLDKWLRDVPTRMYFQPERNITSAD